MEWNPFLKKLLYPPLWLLLPLTAGCAAGLAYIFLQGMEAHPIAYAVYAVSFYTLCAATVYCVTVLPGQLRNMRRKFSESRLGSRYLSDRSYRARISLHVSFTVYLLYTALNLFLFFRMDSWWFLVLTVYYGIMAILRFLLMRYILRHEPGADLRKEWSRSRLCAAILLLVNLCLSGSVLMILYQDKGSDYPGMMIYVMALYTFYSTIHALVDLPRYRKLGSPILSTAKVVSFCAALVSMLNLETAMFAQFGADMAPEHQRIFIILTGAGVSIAIVTLSIHLIVKATKERRRTHHGS